MKPVGLLVLLNVVAWGLALLLLVRQGDLAERLAALEASSPPGAMAGSLAGSPPPPVVEADPDMEIFRKQVARALELNAEEDRVGRLELRLAGLVEKGEIASLTPEQTRRVAQRIAATRREVPEILRGGRAPGQPPSETQEERRRRFREEYGRLRDQVRTELERIVPAADAATIVDDMLREPRNEKTQP